MRNDLSEAGDALTLALSQRERELYTFHLGIRLGELAMGGLALALYGRERVLPGEGKYNSQKP